MCEVVGRGGVGGVLALDARGKSRFLRRSLRLMSATISPCLLTTGSLLFLLSRLRGGGGEER